MPHILTLAMIASVLVMLAALFFQRNIPAALAKLSASLCFVFLAVVLGAHTHPAGRAFFAAFLLSLAGDLALLGRSPKWLTAGIFAFLSAHAAFIVAFFVRGVDLSRAAIGFGCVLLPSVFLARWILRHASLDMRPKVIVYVALITVMVGAAAGASPWLLQAAVIFYVSDICVARQRFIKEAFINRAIGLPLYYGAQWMFAFASAAVPG
ncbi:MAG: lysoplasmalogenase [Deltaproteobacteria bacterium]|nr:lysoplasmalogenase [Deltaproteobacteria bacterium]